MHKLLKRQLKKINYQNELMGKRQCGKFLSMVSDAYIDSDDNREFLEHLLTTSSDERQELYEELEKHSKLELERSEAKYMRLVENLNQHYFFYSHNVEGIFTYLSDSMENILGYSKEEFLVHYLEYLTDDPMNALVENNTVLAMQGIQQKPYQLSIYHKDGTIRYLEVTEIPVLDENGDVTYIDGIARDITENHYIQEKLSHIAKHDMLTALSNRIYLEEQLEIMISNAKRVESSFAVLFLDLDHFKHINDTLGHDVGDKLLKEVATRIKPNIRTEDIFARLGGDEFVIVLNNVDEIYLTRIINKVMHMMRQTWKVDKFDLQVSTSMGVSLYPQDASTMVELMKNADIAMYKAKELGRNNFSFFTEELNKKVHYDMRLEQDMSSALADNQFVLHYQPKQRMKNNSIIGAEALIRWNHPEFGLIYPDKFIELAESTGLISKLGAWVIEEACRAIVRFNAKSTTQGLHVSVNVSTRQLQNDDLLDVIKRVLDENKIKANQLALEITESIMADKNEKVITQLEEISFLGIHISMDDFGTGYSSLSCLNNLPIKTIKIDKSFVDDIPRSGNKKVLVDTIIGMGKTLDMKVLAEGVEAEYQREYLLNAGCIYYQGYLFSKPLLESEYLELLT